MAQKTVTTCDRCGREKQETNHWFAVKIQEPEREDMHGLSETCSIHIEPAQPSIPAGPERKDLCGEQCVSEMVQEWLTNIQNQERAPLVPST